MKSCLIFHSRSIDTASWLIKKTENVRAKCNIHSQVFFWKFTYNITSAKYNKQHWAACTIRLKGNLSMWVLQTSGKRSCVLHFCISFYSWKVSLPLPLPLSFPFTHAHWPTQAANCVAADKVILGKEISKSVKCFQKNTNVSGLWPFFSVRKNRCTVPRNIIDIIKMIEAGARVIVHAGCI